MHRLTFEGNFCDIAMCRENPCPYNGMCSQRQTWERLKEYEDAEQDGRLVVLDEKTALSMYAGARAIENNKRLFGATYVYDVFGKQGGPKEIPYFDAANNLRNIASALAEKGASDGKENT